MSCSSTVCTCVFRASCGTNVLDHLAADRACLAGRQIAVVTVLQVDAAMDKFKMEAANEVGVNRPSG